VIAAAALAGCSGADPAAPERAATSFEQAVAAADAEAACALLSPAVRAAVGEDAGGSCPDALRESPPPSSSPDVVRASRYGRQAVVVTAADTLFLSEFADGWKVIAAGCTREPGAGNGKPYDCAISEG
jgi:hypothetical protein